MNGNQVHEEVTAQLCLCAMPCAASHPHPPLLLFPAPSDEEAEEGKVEEVKEEKEKKTKKIKEVQHEWNLLNKQKPIW